MVGEDGELPRVKPFKYTYQKEIVMYAYFKKLDYFSTECIYAPFAARGLARDFVKDLEVGTHCLLLPSPAAWMQTFAAIDSPRLVMLRRLPMDNSAVVAAV